MSAARSFKQELVGVFGMPVAENPTQAMVEAAFKGMGLAWRYLTVEVRPEDLGAAVQGARAMGWRGFNCTIPHKVRVIEYVDELTPAARLIGAVNCVMHRDGRWMGENTDGKGFVQSVRTVRSVEGQRALILGAGGAARAVAIELALAGAESIAIANRTEIGARTLADHVRAKTDVLTQTLAWSTTIRPPAGTTLVVNATSIGLFPDADAMVPLDVEALEPGTLVCDVIPNPPATRLIQAARKRGLPTLDGLGMLVNQGVIGIRLWTGCEPDSSIMRRALDDVFAS